MQDLMARLQSARTALTATPRIIRARALVMAGSDVFNLQRERGVIETATLIDRTTRRNTRRIVSLALSMPFGGGGMSVDAPIEYGE